MAGGRVMLPRVEYLVRLSREFVGKSVFDTVALGMQGQRVRW